MSQQGVTYRDAVASGSQDGAKSAATALAANAARNYFIIQNQGTNPIFVYLGASGSTTKYHYILKAAAGAADGSGGVLASGPVIYRGIITIDGTTPSYSVLEL